MPKFSVIIPLYNKAGFIKSTLNSVLQQTFKDFEVIVVDDGSTDNGARIVKDFSDNRIRFFQQQNSGASNARNAAMKKADGAYFAFLDGDDLWKPNHLEEINNLIHYFPEEKVFATAIEIEDEKGIYPAPYSDITKEKFQLLNYFKASYGASILSGSSTVVKEEVVREIGDFDEQIKSGQDTDYWIRIGLNYPVAFNNTITVSYTWVSESLSRKTFDFLNKTAFSKFEQVAKQNEDLAKFINFNLFSFWMRSKITGDEKNAVFLKSKIVLRHLSLKQKLLFSANQNQLRLMKKLQKLLKNVGFRISAFEK